MSVGLFLPLPKNLASKFPSLGDHDTSPPHATLLYFGDAPEDRDRFLFVVRSHLRQWPGEITATLRGLRHFDSPNQTVAYDAVRFDADVAGLRSSLISYLSDNGFPATDMSPVYYYPHVTLSYMPPNTVGEYDGPVPEGSWTFDEVEVWGLGDDPVAIPLGGPSSGRVAARYKSKKKIETKDGDEATVYEYSDRQVANRHREKAERVEHLRKHMSDLRARVKDDLKSDDPMTRMTALAVSLMDHTCERVGNDDSADDGHYGVTGWLKKHITIRDGKATIKYVGKSGVKHEKTVDDGPTVTALKALCDGRDGGDAIFDTDDAKVSADEVNDYLAEFDVTAKDIRGFRANDEMCKALRAERAKGPKDLPRARKEKDEILKAEFKRALEHVAEVVGHEAATLRSQYLVPGLEDQYVHDGTVLTSLKTATKSDAQREDEATEKLVKPAPKAKPPRHDLRNERVKAERDPDLDTTDDDLSLNFKKVARRVLVAGMAVRVAARYLWAKSKARKKELEEEFLKSTEGQLYKTPKSDKKEGVSYAHLKKVHPERASGVRKNWMKSRQKKVQGERQKEQKDQKGSEPSEAQKALKKPATPEQIEQSVEKIQGSEAAKAMSEAERDSLSGFLSSVMSGQSIKDSKELEQSIYRHGATHVEKLKGGVDRKTVDALRKVPEGLYGKGVKMTTFDSKKSSDQIAKKQKSREKTKADYEQVKRSVKELPLEVAEAEDSIESKNLDLQADTNRLEKLMGLTNASAIRDFLISETDSEARKKQIQETPDTSMVELNQSDITRLKAKVSTATRAIEKLKATKAEAQKKLEVAERRLPSLEEAIERETSELNAMTAYHVSQEHLSSRLTEMPSGNSDPSKRLSDAARHLQSLPPEMADKAIERSKARRDEKKKELDNAPEDDREALQKELDLADAELAAGTHDKYLRMSQKEAEKDQKASVIRSLNDRGVGADNEHVQTLLREDATQSEVSKAVYNLADKMPDKDLLEVSDLGSAYDTLKDYPNVMRALRGVLVDNLASDIKKDRAKKTDKGKVAPAKGTTTRVEELAEAARDLPEKDRKTVEKVVRETATNLPAADRETVEDIIKLDIPDASAAPKGDQKEKGPSSPGEYREMLLEGAGDEEARQRIKDLTSEELNERFEKYKAGKTARRVASRFLAYSTRTR